MSSSVPHRDTRIQQRLRALGTNTAHCGVPGCNEDDPFALTSVDPDIACYEHQALAAGRSVVEDQHTQGVSNGADTVAMLGNDHRVSDELKIEWPRETLRNADGSPLLRAAACIRGWLDVLRVVIERTIGWIPAFLETLNAKLIDRLGPSWWGDLGLETT